MCKAFSAGERVLIERGLGVGWAAAGSYHWRMIEIWGAWQGDGAAALAQLTCTHHP